MKGPVDSTRVGLVGNFGVFGLGGLLCTEGNRRKMAANKRRKLDASGSGNGSTGGGGSGTSTPVGMSQFSFN